MQITNAMGKQSKKKAFEREKRQAWTMDMLSIDKEEKSKSKSALPHHNSFYCNEKIT